MIFVLMTSRSGSSMVCEVLANHGLKWNDGQTAPAQAARNGAACYDVWESPKMKAACKVASGGTWPLGDSVMVTPTALASITNFLATTDIEFVKVAYEYADLIEEWARVTGNEAKFISVWREPEAVADSHFRRFGRDWDYARDVAEKRYKLMRGVIVRTTMMARATRMVRGEIYISGIIPAVELGCDFNMDKTLSAIHANKFHT